VILNETSSDVVEAYLVIRAALSLSPYLGVNTEAWKARRSLLETLTGIKKGAFGDRAEYCVGQVEGSLGFAAGRYFVQKTFGGNSKNKAMKVISGGLCNQFPFNMLMHFFFSADIVKAFKQSIKHIDWMDEVSSRAAAEKVRPEILLCQPSGHLCRQMLFELKLVTRSPRTQMTLVPLSVITVMSISTKRTFLVIS
jgi:endothelin-converting enzyme